MAAYSTNAEYSEAIVAQFGTITANFLPFGDPLEFACNIAKFTNGTNAGIEISTNGTTVHDVFLSGDSMPYGISANKGKSETFLFPKGTQLYARYITAPTSGAFYFVGIHGK